MANKERVLLLALSLATTLGGPLEPAATRDIGLQRCISNFDVHKDKIIRTQDSRDMGAKYLNEIDLGSREECLRLCCETEDCDVFVFEEKNTGSCYLFNCGPPENFKCKFTHHVNYSSAVLTVNRRTSDLESEIKLTKHEQDLAKLRKPGAYQEAAPPESKPTIQTTTSTARSKILTAVSSKTKAEDKDKKCSRYQFECRSSGECIAIYNACDGIPQCADGSDEAPELGCPEVATSTAPAAERANNPSANVNSRYNSPNSAQRNYQPIYQQPAAQQDEINPAIQSGEPQRQEIDFMHPISDHRNLPQYDPALYGQIPPRQSQPAWVPHQSNQMPQVPTYDKSVFNHKETGLQVLDGPETSQAQYPEVNGNNPRDYSKINAYYEDPYRQRLPAVWPGNVQDDYSQQTKTRDWSQQNTPVKDAYRPQLRDDPTKLAKEHENPKHEQDKMAHELKTSKETANAAVEQTKQIKIEKHEHVHRADYPQVVAYKMTDELQDGVAEAPSGAILSLTFGLIITCVMAIMIGCRLRMVRRKMRKGGKSYAHDADYLVNGMYL